MAGRGSAKNIANERAARVKATRQYVYISGLKGHYTLEVGVAYHYRGHFIYAYPASNPIEPVPFSTKKGINIVGVVQDQAPLYDHTDPNLVLEQTIAALDRSCVHEWEFQEKQEEIKKQETKKALEAEKAGETDKENESEAVTDNAATPKASAQEPLPSQAPSRVPSFTTLLVPSQVSPNIVSRTGSHATLYHPSPSPIAIPRIGAVEGPPVEAIPPTSYTPHDRGHYLAYSAPGSRHTSVDNTPFVSRPVSPNHLQGLSVRGAGSHGSLLRPIASTSRLNQLLAAEGFRRSLSPLTDVAEGGRQGSELSHQEEQDEDMVANLSVSQGWMNPNDISAFVETVSRQASPSRPLRSRPWSRVNSRSPQAHSNSPDNDEMAEGGLYLHGLGHPDVIRDDASRAHTRESSPFRAPDYQSAESAAYLRGLAQKHYDMVSTRSRSHTPPKNELDNAESNIQVIASSSRSQTPIGQAPTGLFGSPVFASSQHRDATTPAFTFPAPQQQDTSSFPAFMDPVSSDSYIVHTDKKPKPLNTGRPRAASKALNEAYNAANPSSTPRLVFPSNLVPSNDRLGTSTADNTSTNTVTATENPAFTPRCPIHSESCNGQDVVHEHITQRARNGAGFKDLFPTVTCDDGRVMVDWAKLRDEEMKRAKDE